MSLRINPISFGTRNINFSGKCRVGDDKEMKDSMADIIAYTSGTSLYGAEDKAQALIDAAQEIAQETPDDEDYYIRYFRYGKYKDYEYDPKVIQIYLKDPYGTGRDILFAQEVSELSHHFDITSKFKDAVMKAKETVLEQNGKERYPIKDDLYSQCVWFPPTKLNEKQTQLSKHVREMIDEELVEIEDF